MGVPTGEEREKIMIMASIAEAEVNSQEYYGKVTRVILNRIDIGMRWAWTPPWPTVWASPRRN